MARTHVVLADDVVKAIDEHVGSRGRSRFLEQAAREKLARIELEQALQATKGIAKGQRYSHWRDRDAAARWVREGRAADRDR